MLGINQNSSKNFLKLHQKMPDISVDNSNNGLGLHNQPDR